MKVRGWSEAEAVKASRRTLLKPGMYDALIRDAVETESKRGNEMIDVSVVVYDGIEDYAPALVVHHLRAG